MSEPHPHAIARLFRYAKAYRGDIYLATLYSVLNKLFDILPEVLIGIAVDTVVKRQDSFLARFGIPSPTQQLMALGTLTVVIWGLESLFEYLYSVKWRNLAQALQHQLRMDAYTHIQNTDISYFESQKTGNLVSILNDDINQLERFLDDGANTIIQIISSSVLISLIFFFIAPFVAALAMLPVPLILFGAYYLQHLIGPRYAAVRAKAGELNARFSNNLSGIATIKSYTAEAYEIDSLDAQSRAYQAANVRAIRLSSAINPVIRIAILIGFTATLVYGGLLTLRGELAIGAYSILVFLTQRLLWPLTGLAEITDNYYRAMASADRVLGLLKVPIRIVSKKIDGPTASLRGDIRFDRVGFHYHPYHPVLRDISLAIPAGKTIGFVGSTGSGKSTLMKLLLRFYDPTTGHITIDDHDIAHLPLGALRQNIGYVSQDVFLFDGTVAQNIGYGSFSATLDEIVEAAKSAEAHAFITRLPEGYQTPIGERGIRLSGGQRQRLSIARAILKDPPILILDEATSAVDNETEGAIQRSLKKIVVGRTTLIVAHRLNTLSNADRIYVLEEGMIVEQGTHHTLLALDGIYAGLWALQTTGRPIDPKTDG